MARTKPCEHAAKDLTVMRKYIVPELNLECDDYTNVINWSKYVGTKLPITTILSEKNYSEKYRIPKMFHQRSAAMSPENN